MRIVIEIGAHDGGESVTHYTTESFPLRIGRGYNNHIILQDPHISAHHAEILHDGTDWILRDMGSENGCRVNGTGCTGGQATLHSGDHITLGRTTLRVFNPLHPVPAATAMEEQSDALRQLSRRPVAWGIFILSLFLIAALGYYSVWMEDPESFVATVTGLTGLGMILWAAPWAVAGRLIRHRSRFHVHVALAAVYIIVSTLLWLVQTALDFLYLENIYCLVLEGVLNMLLLGLLIYGSLTAATYMTHKRRKVAAAFFALGLIGVIYALEYISTDKFNARPEYPVILQPYLGDWVSVSPIETYMADNARLFDKEGAVPVAKTPETETKPL